MELKIWEHLFKPETRNSGSVLLRKGKISMRSLSDTEVQAYVQGAGSVKVVLKSPSVSSDLVQSACSCPQGKKGQFCKHLWAVLLEAEKKNLDFFDAKFRLELLSGDKVPAKEKFRPISDQSSARAEAFAKAKLEQKELQKEKQAAYRKAQYQKQKLIQQKTKSEKKDKKQSKLFKSQFSQEVELALGFFQDNGFELRDSMDLESIGFAMKKLARVFHPDLGGDQEQMQELVRHSEALTWHLKSSKR